MVKQIIFFYKLQTNYIFTSDTRKSFAYYVSSSFKKVYTIPEVISKTVQGNEAIKKKPSSHNVLKLRFFLCLPIATGSQ